MDQVGLLHHQIIQFNMKTTHTVCGSLQQLIQKRYAFFSLSQLKLRNFWSVLKLFHTYLNRCVNLRECVCSFKHANDQKRNVKKISWDLVKLKNIIIKKIKIILISVKISPQSNRSQLQFPNHKWFLNEIHKIKIKSKSRIAKWVNGFFKLHLDT